MARARLHQVTQARRTGEGRLGGVSGTPRPARPPCRLEGGRPARLLAARRAENVSVFHEQIVECLAKVCGLWHPGRVRQFPKLGNGIRGVVTRHLCLIAFRF